MPWHTKLNAVCYQPNKLINLGSKAIIHGEDQRVYEKYFQQAIRIAPKNIKVLQSIAALMHKQGRHKLVQELYQKALVLAEQKK